MRAYINCNVLYYEICAAVASLHVRFCTRTDRLRLRKWCEMCVCTICLILLLLLRARARVCVCCVHGEKLLLLLPSHYKVERFLDGD